MPSLRDPVVTAVATGHLISLASERVDIGVGAGFTGLWTALEIKKRDVSVDVTVIEADLCGSGASGRNGGFAMTWMSKAATLLKICGGQEGVRLLRASEDAVRAIGAFCDSQGLGAHFRQHGWLWTASSASQIGAWESTLERLDKHGLEPFDVLDAGEASHRRAEGKDDGVELVDVDA